ncbi:MAG: hypothetical protein JWM59_1559 [Verrucomicrobiales bacterium]|nr:hypothetical protein [Verrucomicrobiales bacterium]
MDPYLEAHQAIIAAASAPRLSTGWTCSVRATSETQHGRKLVTTTEWTINQRGGLSVYFSITRPERDYNHPGEVIITFCRGGQALPYGIFYLYPRPGSSGSMVWLMAAQSRSTLMSAAQVIIWTIRKVDELLQAPDEK